MCHRCQSLASLSTCSLITPSLHHRTRSSEVLLLWFGSSRLVKRQWSLDPALQISKQLRISEPEKGQGVRHPTCWVSSLYCCFSLFYILPDDLMVQLTDSDQFLFLPLLATQNHSKSADQEPKSKTEVILRRPVYRRIHRPRARANSARSHRRMPAKFVWSSRPTWSTCSVHIWSLVRRVRCPCDPVRYAGRTYSSSWMSTLARRLFAGLLYDHILCISYTRHRSIIK